MELKLFTTFIVVAAILASPKHRDFNWSYRSSIYRVHWFQSSLCESLQETRNCVETQFLVSQFLVWKHEKCFPFLK